MTTRSEKEELSQLIRRLSSALEEDARELDDKGFMRRIIQVKPMMNGKAFISIVAALIGFLSIQTSILLWVMSLNTDSLRDLAETVKQNFTITTDNTGRIRDLENK